MTVFTLGDDVLERIRRNDPDIKTLEFCLYGLSQMRGSGNIAAIGHDIGQTPSITELVVSYCHESYYAKCFVMQEIADMALRRIPAPEWEVFFDEVCQSRSVTSIKFLTCVLGGYFLKLFRIPNLETVVFDNCTITPDTACALWRARRLQKVELIGRVKEDDSCFRSGVKEDVGCHRKKQIGLFPPVFNPRDFFTNKTWIEGSIQESLGHLFSDPQRNIMELVLSSHSIEILPKIRNGLVNSSALQSLKISGNLRLKGWQAVSDILSSAVTALKVLDLTKSEIDNQCAHALAAGLSLNTTLEELIITNHEDLGAAGWLNILSALRNSKLRLKQLCVHWQFNSRKINVEVASSFAEVLIAKSDTIEKFSMIDWPAITADGWTALCSAFLTVMPHLSELSLGNRNFDDNVTVVLASRFSNMPALKTLFLHRTNTSSKGWDAISKGLCDISSLRAIEQSNHTLVKIRVTDSSFSDITPVRVLRLLLMNRRGTANAIALKIVHFFYDRITLQDFVYDRPEIQNKLVPSILSWLGRDLRKRHALYHFVLNHSYLFEGAGRRASMNESKGVSVSTHWWEVVKFRKKKQLS
ncbi:hypothetical protein ACHAW6_001999 [Cyclotella cf. meneghiniana]